MEIRDKDLGLVQLSHEVRGKDVALAVVVLRVVREKHAKSVSYGYAGGDDQEGVGKLGVLGVGKFVKSVPCDEHL